MRTLLRRFGYDLSRPGGPLVPWHMRPRVVPGGLRRPPAPDGTVDVPIRACASALGFSHAEDGWNPYVATLREWAECRGLTYEESALGRLHARYRPVTLQEALFDDIASPVDVVSRVPAWFSTRVWIARRRDVEAAIAAGQRGEAAVAVNGGSWYFGPPDAAQGRRQFRELLDLCGTIVRHGYVPDAFAAAPIRGYFLVDGDRWRFIVTDGQHRTAVLRFLGAERIRARLWGGPSGVDAARLGPWLAERGGAYPATVAHLLHRRMLLESGLDKAGRLGVGGVRPNRALTAPPGWGGPEAPLPSTGGPPGARGATGPRLQFPRRRMSIPRRESAT